MRNVINLDYMFSNAPENLFTGYADELNNLIAELAALAKEDKQNLKEEKASTIINKLAVLQSEIPA